MMHLLCGFQGYTGSRVARQGADDDDEEQKDLGKSRAIIPSSALLH